MKTDLNLLLQKYQTILFSLLNTKTVSIELLNNSTQKWMPICIDYYNKKETEKTWELGSYRVMKGESLIASWKLYQLQHCCAYAVSCNAFVHNEYRNKGVGTLMNNLRQDICRILGYSALLCTDIDKNENQRKLLKTNGWKDIHNLINKRTGNNVYLSVINL